MTDAVPEGFSPFPPGDGFVDLIGPLYWAIRDGRGVLAFRVEDRHANPAGICHGGMMMSVMDMVVGFNVQLTADRNVFAPSIQMSHDFLQPGRIGDWLEGTADFVHTTRRTGFANGYLVGPNGPVMRSNGIAKLPGEDNKMFNRPSEMMKRARALAAAQRGD